MPAPTSKCARPFDKTAAISEYPLETASCGDLHRSAPTSRPRAEITPSDLEAAVEKAGGPGTEGGTVLLCTGHHERTFPARICDRQLRR